MGVSAIKGFAKNINGDFLDYRAYDSLLDRYLTKMANELSDEKVLVLEKLLIKTLKDLPPVWQLPLDVNDIPHMKLTFLMNHLIKFEEYFSDEAKKELRNYAKQIKRQIGQGNKKNKNSMLIRWISKIEYAVGEKIK